MTFKPIETQEDFDAAVKERIERAKKSAVEKYSDYDDIKAKLKAFEESDAAGKSELEKLSGELKKMREEKEAEEKAKARSAMRKKVAGELKVPENMVHGDDEEAMRESAQAALDYAKSYKPTAPSVPGAGKSAPGARSGEDEDMARFVSQLFGEDK